MWAERSSEGNDVRMRTRAEGDRPGSGLPLGKTVAGRLADTMFALSTPSRVLILGCLLDGPRSVGDLAEMLGMEQSAVSHQLRVLREHRLVRVERDGRRRVYGLYDEHVAVLLRAGLDHVSRPGPQSASERAGSAP